MFQQRPNAPGASFGNLMTDRHHFDEASWINSE
jgi:hypothetical protein